MENAQIITLYHGSKSGIQGTIAPISRERCDFGKGFYMGTECTQPLTLICNYPKAKIYTLGVAMADEICRKYRREGQFFDEILKAGE